MPQERTILLSARIHRAIPASRAAIQLAGHFGFTAREEQLYDQLPLRIAPGEVVAVVGPSGAGKSVLLRLARRRLPNVVDLADRAPRPSLPAINCFRGGTLAERLEVLSRCGLAEPAALLTPAGLLSGGQRYRLALARCVWKARRMNAPAVVIADEFAGTLDRATAWMLARQVRRMAEREKIAFLLAMPDDWLLPALRPDTVIVKPLAQPVVVLPGEAWLAAHASESPVPEPATWPIRAGTIADYRAVGWCHYLAGAPAAHLRVWAIDAPAALASALGAPAIAAVCVVSPPVPNVRGRHAAFPGRYTVRDKRLALRRLNREIECISRVVVHPVYRSAGLALRLVRHAIASARTRKVEALAAMGAVHPLFERAGMTPMHLPPLPEAQRLMAAVHAAGLSAEDVVTVEPLRAFLASGPPEPRMFLRRELRRFACKAVGPRALARMHDPLPAVCRKASAGYVYYHVDRREM